jgi:hypothetical protein
LTHIGTTGSRHLITNLTGEAGSNFGADSGSGRPTAIFNAFKTAWTLMIPLTGIVVGVGNTSSDENMADLPVRTVSVTVT